MLSIRPTLILACALAFLASGPAVAQPGEMVATTEPSEQEALVATTEEPLTAERRRQREAFADLSIDERLGERVSADIPLVATDGRAVTLGDYLRDDRPLVLAFVYHDCPMLCSLVLTGLTRSMQQATLDLGGDYEVLAVSIDPRDTPEQAAAARARFAAPFGEAAASYHFLTGTDEAVRQLAEEVGFRYRWVEQTQEYAHTAVLVFLSPTGVVTRYLYGIEFAPRDFRTALVEAGEGRVGTLMDQLFLYCFNYDPQAGGYALVATRVMKLGGLLTLLVLGGLLLLFWRRERRRNDARRREASRSWGGEEDALGLAASP
jgi:protein SCO1